MTVTVTDRPPVTHLFVAGYRELAAMGESSALRYWEVSISAVKCLCDALDTVLAERDALAAELAAVKAVPVVGLHDLSIDELIAAGDAISREKVERYRASGPTRNGA